LTSERVVDTFDIICLLLGTPPCKLNVMQLDS